jgi:UDP-N-acetylmuramate dehydrogenase
VSEAAVSALRIQKDVPLSEHTSLELGGPAEFFAEIRERDELLEALAWARTRSLRVTVLGGGSNVVVSDRGVPGLVLHMATAGITLHPAADSCIVSAQAGERWDALVARSVGEQLAGVECLSGIPGSVGAAPIQNIGAYGQEVGSCIKSVEVLDLHDSHSHFLERADCGFAYRYSRWKRSPGREIVLSVQLELRRDGEPTLRYAELERALAGRAPSLAAVREAVLSLRRSKSMLLEPGSSDPNRRSVGSFFLNPVVCASEAQRIAQLAQERGWLDAAGSWPQYPQPDGSVKLSAAWLIERSGTQKDERRGPVGISSRHCLALVHHGGGTTQALLELADEVQQRVRACFGVQLDPEPVRLGFDVSPS